MPEGKLTVTAKKKQTKPFRGRAFWSWILSLPGAILLFVVLYYAEIHLHGGVREAVMICTSAIVTFTLYSLAGGYLTAILAQGIGLYSIFLFYLADVWILDSSLSSVFTSVRLFGILLVWFTGVFVLFFIRIFSRGDKDTPKRRESFQIAFHLSSVFFLTFYAVILFFLFFLMREADLSGNRRLNLIPFQGAFAVYWPKIRDGKFGNDVFIQFFGNLLIFTPLGFYLGIYCRNMKKAVILLIPVAAAGLIEATQFVFNMGAADVDDLWMNVLGAWFGYLLIYLVGWMRARVTDGRERTIF